MLKVVLGLLVLADFAETFVVIGWLALLGMRALIPLLGLN